MQDQIVDEVRRIREEHAARFGYDVDAIYADLKRMEKESKDPRVSFGPRRVAKAPSPLHRKRQNN
jgi:hypothetical protein